METKAPTRERIFSDNPNDFRTVDYYTRLERLNNIIEASDGMGRMEYRKYLSRRIREFMESAFLRGYAAGIGEDVPDEICHLQKQGVTDPWVLFDYYARQKGF